MDSSSQSVPHAHAPPSIPAPSAVSQHQLAQRSLPPLRTGPPSRSRLHDALSEASRSPISPAHHSPALPPPTSQLPPLPSHRQRPAQLASPLPSPLGPAPRLRQPVSAYSLARTRSRDKLPSRLDLAKHPESSEPPSTLAASIDHLRSGARSTPPTITQFNHTSKGHYGTPPVALHSQAKRYVAPVHPPHSPASELGGAYQHDSSDSDDPDARHFPQQLRLIDLLPDDDDLFDDEEDEVEAVNHYNQSFIRTPLSATSASQATQVLAARPDTSTAVRRDPDQSRTHQGAEVAVVPRGATSDTSPYKSNLALRVESSLAPPSRTQTVELNYPRETLYTSFAPPSPDPTARHQQASGQLSPKPTLTRARTDTFGTAASPNTESFRNLNRWSVSSAGTAYRPVTREKDQGFPTSLSAPPAKRPPSVDSFTQVVPTIESIKPGSPKRLTKRRPSVPNTSSPSPKPAKTRRSTSRLRRPSPPPNSTISPSPPPNLPPIVTLPPLDTGADATLASPRTAAGISPVIPTPSSVFAPQNGERSDYFWDAIAHRDNTQKPTRTVAFAFREDEADDMPGHTRSRSSNAKGSSDSTKARDKSKPSQKAMLSKALGKANTAVQLDNAQHYESAKEAYVEACDLLHFVLARTTGEEDRKKLEAIRGTYTSRITELESLVPSRAMEKRLPARPGSMERAESPDDMEAYDDPNEPIIIETATVLMREDAQANLPPPGLAPSPIPSDNGPLKNQTISIPSNGAMNGPYSPLQSTFSSRRPFTGNTLAIPRGDAMPAPLSPRRAPSPAKPPSPEPVVRQDFSLPPDRLEADTYMQPSHARNPSHESVSWLDPIDESGGSACSSVHSRTSSLGIRRKHIRGPSGDTEAEFDAALDAAVEAAYDDGYEPMDTYGDNDSDDNVANAMRRVELAKQRVRQTEREAGIESDRDWERQPYAQLERDSMTFGELYNGSDSEDEERMLDEMTREYAMGDFSFAPRDKQQPGAGRESNSSSVTSRTWNTSSMGSNAPTSTSVLSTVTENPQAALNKISPPSLPPVGALPQIPSPQSKATTASVRARRLSGQGAKQLKIETATMGSPPRMPPPDMPASAIQAKNGGYISQQRQTLQGPSGSKPANFSLRTPSSPVRTASPAEAMIPPTPPPATGNVVTPWEDERADSPSSLVPNLRTNFSSASLKSLRQRQASVSGFDDADLSPDTPLTTTLTNSSIRQTSIPAVPPTPMGLGFGNKDKSGFGGMQLFESDFHVSSPTSPHLARSLREQSDDIPLALEPCPSDVMLRPFWLMRALYQTLCHPRGGYITNKLFVPRDAWKVKGVKLRGIEEKCSQLDLLTAALLKLALVDSNDADAVLEEMQYLEGVLEGVQQNLIKKFGHEVGTQGVSSLSGDKESEAAPSVPRSSSVSGKGGAFSWRRLRSKNSAANLTSAYGAKTSSGGSGASIPEHTNVTSAGLGAGTLPSLPMVAQPASRPAKRDVQSVKFDGPFAGYMASLARLFDAAQTVDSIARQVDDPGLRHADKTQVGLELCTRHAAEFFSFYICRFVLADLGMLLDKFVKRGSEWVLT